jgi:ectoine hydroxylase
MDPIPPILDNRPMSSVADNARDVYRRDGYLLCKGFFADEILLLTALVDRNRDVLLEREDITIDSRGAEASNLGYLGKGDDVVAVFAGTARLVNLVRELLGDDVYLLKGRLNIKWGDSIPGRRGGWDPHQDRAAWAKEGLPGDAALTVAIAVDDSRVENGTLEVIPGSHRGGLLEHTGIDAGYGIREELVRPLLENGGRRPLEMAAGDMTVFSGDIIHMSMPNVGSQRRALLFLTFNAVGNSPAKGVGPSRYQCTGPLAGRDDRKLADLARAFRVGDYSPELDWDAIREERDIDVAEDIDSGWTDLTPTLR